MKKKKQVYVTKKKIGPPTNPDFQPTQDEIVKGAQELRRAMLLELPVANMITFIELEP